MCESAQLGTRIEDDGKAVFHLFPDINSQSVQAFDQTFVFQYFEDLADCGDGCAAVRGKFLDRLELRSCRPFPGADLLAESLRQFNTFTLAAHLMTFILFCLCFIL